MVGEGAAPDADLGVHGAMQQGDAEAATGGHDLRGMPVAGTGAILAQGTITGGVTRFDRPMATDPRQEMDGAGASWRWMVVAGRRQTSAGSATSTAMSSYCLGWLPLTREQGVTPLIEHALREGCLGVQGGGGDHPAPQ